MMTEPEAELMRALLQRYDALHALEGTGLGPITMHIAPTGPPEIPTAGVCFYPEDAVITADEACKITIAIGSWSQSVNLTLGQTIHLNGLYQKRTLTSE